MYGKNAEVVVAVPAAVLMVIKPRGTHYKALHG